MISYDQTRELLDYNKKTGALRWRAARHRIKAGQSAFANKNGRPVVIYQYWPYQASHIIWLWMTGEWPPKWVDHKDGDPYNTKWDNLRLVTPSQNAINRSKTSTSPSPYKGVIRLKWGRSSGTRWRARIQIPGGKRLELGIFGSAEEAHDEYKKAALKYHGEFTRFSELLRMRSE